MSDETYFIRACPALYNDIARESLSDEDRDFITATNLVAQDHRNSLLQIEEDFKQIKDNRKP